MIAVDFLLENVEVLFFGRTGHPMRLSEAYFFVDHFHIVWIKLSGHLLDPFFQLFDFFHVSDLLIGKLLQVDFV